VLEVEAILAIERQHRPQQILERVSTYFGYRAAAQFRGKDPRPRDTFRFSRFCHKEQAKDR
jgi:hypothetical protein